MDRAVNSSIVQEGLSLELDRTLHEYNFSDQDLLYYQYGAESYLDNIPDFKISFISMSQSLFLISSGITGITVVFIFEVKCGYLSATQAKRLLYI